MARKVTARRVWVSTAAAWLSGFLIFLPILWMVLTSFKTELEAFAMPPTFLFFHWTTENYATVQGRSDYVHHALNSIMVAGGSTLIALLIAIPAAWSMAFAPTKRTKDVLLWMLSTKMMPPVGVLVPIYLIYRDFGLLDTRAGLVLILCLGNLPIVIWMLFTYFKEIPKDILEAARMDGATIGRELVYVLTPMAIPGLASTLLLNFILAWNEAFWTLNLSTLDAAPLTVFIASYSSPEGLFWAKLSAASTLAIAPIIILGWFTQRQRVRKSFGPVNIIEDANLDIEDGSFVVFVGPSGCGKTTLLRLIAGLEDVTGGQILIDGRNVVDVPPAKRGLSMVFQSYALYPHMSVRGNIAFGLKMAGLPRPEIDRKVEAAAATLNLTPYLERKPRDLSGGQRQRVAIGRAIVREPKAFLFDEPLSNLDAALRVQMRLEVTKLQKQLATTAVYVTHDQVEAMTMADKIVVLNAGHIEQYGSPLELYERPANLFVAGFIGSPKMNFVSGEAAGEPGVATLGVRPEHLKIGKGGWPGTVSVAEHLGSDTFLYVDAGKLGMLTARCVGEFSLKAGDSVWLNPDPARLHRFDKDGEVIRR